MAPPRLLTIEPRLHVADLRRSLAFYRDILGFAVEAVDESLNFAMLRRDGVGLQLVRADDHNAPSGGGATLWIGVEGVPALHEALKARVPIEWGPEVYGYGRREFAVRDPDGHLVILSEPTDDPPTCPSD